MSIILRNSWKLVSLRKKLTFIPGTVKYFMYLTSCPLSPSPEPARGVKVKQTGCHLQVSRAGAHL